MKVHGRNRLGLQKGMSSPMNMGKGMTDQKVKAANLGPGKLEIGLKCKR